MKTLKIFLLLFLFPCVATLSQTTMTKPLEKMREAPQNARETKSIEQVVVRFGDAWAVNDIATLDGLLSADYIHTDFFGRVQDRAQWLDYMKDRKAKNIVNRLSFEDLTIRIYGDTAVVTGRNIIKGALTVPANEASNEIRFTQVLHKTHGDWLRTCFQATAVQPMVVR
jgi:ketosteroid isomerase-like protein